MNTRHVLQLVVFALAFTGNITGLAAPTESLAWRVEYDDQGRVARRINPADQATNYSYVNADDGSLRSITATPPEGAAVTWRIDMAGRLQSMRDAEGDIAYRYDDHGRLVSVERTGSSAIRYSYDDAGRLAELKVGDFYHVGYKYDFLGRLSALDTNAGIIRHEYETGQNTVIRSLPNGVKTFWKKQPNGVLEKITHGFFKKPDDTQYSVLAQYTYVHGPDERIMSISEKSPHGSGVRSFGYDTMGRLTKATGLEGEEYHYEYDLVGNRTRATATGRPDQVCTSDWAGRLTSINGTPCRHDAAGNLTEVADGGKAREYRYHPSGQIAEVGFGGSSVKYRYDGNGRLVARQTAKGVMRFTNDPFSAIWQPLVIEEDGGVRTLVIWDGSSPLALVRNGKAEFLLQDHLGSVRQMVDGSGSVIRKMDYDPFGTMNGDNLASALHPGFAGLFWDAEAGVSLTLARGYVAELGQFLQPDPQKRMPSSNSEDCSLYSYCGSDSLSFIDRNGADRERAEAELADIESKMRDLVAREVSHNFPNNNGDIPGYLKCWQWQDLVFDTLTSNGKRYQEWNIKPYAELGNAFDRFTHDVITGEKSSPSSIFEKHFFVVAESKTDPGKSYKLDPWRSWLNPLKSLEYEFGNAGKPIPFKPDIKRYIPNEFGNPNRDQRSSFAINSPQPTSATWNGAMVQMSSTVATPDEIATYKATGQYKALNPSPVGGVYLGGACAALDGMGALQGVRVDSNRNLVLIGEDGGDVRLPSLRLDDLVTVFRSVYLEGEGPTVTIDPDPENPEKSAMFIKHSRATEGTYVGWVLYEADRLMKGYNLGMDNITRKDIASQVPGYKDVLDTMYFGTADPRKSQKEGVWERFWIVPAAANRFDSPRRELTLFDVPLKVKTQKMKWAQGQLVDDLTGSSSPGALAFTSWFTKRYDSIAAEQFLIPPVDSGINRPVPVFAELRRIALMTSIAEKLRDQGVPMPFWMRDYDIRRVSFEGKTPAMEITRKRQDGNVTRTARIFGGVELSADSKMVKTYTNSAEVSQAPPELREQAGRVVKLAERLDQSIAQAVPAVGAIPLLVSRVADSSGTFQAASIPGANTLALGPCQLSEVDLVVPLGGGSDIRLTRSCNSFFNPKGPWGRVWAWDLPRLQQIRVPVSRDGSKVAYSTGYELLSPLNSIYAQFKDFRAVPELKGTRLQVPDKNGPFLGIATERPKFLKDAETLVLLLKNGEEWHFAQHGELVAIKQGSQITVYERGSDAQVTRIVGLVGGRPAAQISMEYASNGKLLKATGSSLRNRRDASSSVSFAYDPSGQLSGVTSSEGTVGYSYKGPWVSAVTWKSSPDASLAEDVHSFEYDARGRVLSESNGGTRTEHSFSLTTDGVAGTSRTGAGARNGPVATTATRYDLQMRPIKETTADGAVKQWTYPVDGGVEMIASSAKQQTLKVVESGDRRTRIVQQGDAPRITSHFDDGGHLTDLSEGRNRVLKQEWRSDGQLGRSETPTQAATLNYDNDGLLNSILLHPPDSGQRLVDWQETKLDVQSRPVEIKDSGGANFQFGYDESGSLSSAVQKTREGNLGYNLKRDNKGRVETIKSSWGDITCGYDNAGIIKRIASSRDNKSSSVDFAGGQVQTVTNWDGSRTTVDYQPKSQPGTGRPVKISCANGLNIEPEYDKQGRLLIVKVGAHRRVRIEYDRQGRMVTYAMEPVK